MEQKLQNEFKPCGRSLKELNRNEMEQIYGSNQEVEPYSWLLTIKLTIKSVQITAANTPYVSAASVSGLLSLKSYNEDCI